MFAGVWDVRSGDSDQMVHMNILITCVLAAFLLGACLAGAAVYCYRDVFLHHRKRRKVPRAKDEESPPPPLSSGSTGSLTKLSGLLETPVKEFPSAMETARIYFNREDDDKIPELAALPTPDATPVLHQKNQWERTPAKGTKQHKEAPPKSPQNGNIPSAVVLPNATHQKALQAGDTGTLRSIRKERSVDARNTLNELLKHLNQGAEAENMLTSTPRPRQHLTLEPEIPPKVPSREASLYSPPSFSGSSSLPRNSPTKRLDVPSVPSSPTGQTGTLDRQRFHRLGSMPRYAPSCSSPGMVTRQSSFRLGPPTPPSRMDSRGISRQHSYSGHGSLPHRTSLKRTASLKPDVPPKPGGFAPHARPANKYSY